MTEYVIVNKTHRLHRIRFKNETKATFEQCSFNLGVENYTYVTVKSRSLLGKT